MTNLVKELRQAIKEARISPERASHFIGCSAKSVFRWLHGEHNPRPGHQRMIEQGIEKIREAYPPERESSYSLALRARGLWRKIKKDMTLEEKSELFDINFSKGTKAYIEKLQELVKKYGK